jgi:hypothetical protein
MDLNSSSERVSLPRRRPNGSGVRPYLAVLPPKDLSFLEPFDNYSRKGNGANVNLRARCDIRTSRRMVWFVGNSMREHDAARYSHPLLQYPRGGNTQR